MKYQTPAQQAARIMADSKAADERTALILALIDSKPPEARESALRSVINQLCFECESAKKMVRQRDDYIQEIRGD